jgi:hypothetical protein
MVGQTRRVALGPCLQHREQPGVDVAATVGRDVLLDRQPQQLVPEPRVLLVDHEQSGGDQIVQGLPQVGRDRREQLQLDAGTHECRDAGTPTPSLVEPPDSGEDRVPDRGRDGDVAGGQRLGDQEGVPPGESEELLAHESGRASQPLHAARRERREADAAGRPLRRELTERDPKRVVGLHLVVAVGHEHEHR